MKIQIVVLSMVMMAVHSPETVLNIKSSGNLSKTISKPQHSDFVFLRTNRGCGGITTVWGVPSIDNVGCFMVQRTSDNPNDPDAVWEDLNFIASTSERWYRWTDESVPAGCVSYRIMAYLYDGNTITSNVSRVRTGRH